MKVEAFDENGKPVLYSTGRAEFVCTAPSPSMPIYFWDDPEMKKFGPPISMSIRMSGGTGITFLSTSGAAS